MLIAIHNVNVNIFRSLSHSEFVHNRLDNGFKSSTIYSINIENENSSNKSKQLIVKTSEVKI